MRRIVTGGAGDVLQWRMTRSPNRCSLGWYGGESPSWMANRPTIRGSAFCPLAAISFNRDFVLFWIPSASV
jgi:hypothetical protein